MSSFGLLLIGLFVLGSKLVPALLQRSEEPLGLPAPVWLGGMTFLLVLFFLFGLG